MPVRSITQDEIRFWRRRVFDFLVAEEEAYHVERTSNAPGQEMYLVQHVAKPGEYILISGTYGDEMFAWLDTYPTHQMPRVASLCVWSYESHPDDPDRDGEAIREWALVSESMTFEAAMLCIRTALRAWLGPTENSAKD